MEKEYIVIDIETTGLHPKRDKIIEIGAILVKNSQVVETKEMLIHSGRVIEQRLTDLTGLKEEDFKNAPYIQDVIGEWKLFLDQSEILLGHNIAFDYVFVKQAMVNAGFSFEKKGIDTLMIARKYLQDLESRRLGYLCQHYQIKHEPHRALSDAKATASLYKVLCDNFETQDNSPDFMAKGLNYRVKRESPISKKQIEQLERILKRYNLKSDYELETLTKNEASRYYDCIISSQGRSLEENE